MIEAWSTDAVYAAERALMATLDDGELMARAVEGLAGVAAARLEESGGEAVAALVGPGNNGADALYAVARLAEAGWNAVAVHHDHVHEGARAAAEAAGVVLTTDPSGLGGGRRRARRHPRHRRACRACPTWAVGWLAALSETAHVIAVDLPSGQDPMGGELDPDGVFADETVTFSVAKPVHLLPPTEQACGLLTVVDIGLELDDDPVGAAPRPRRRRRALAGARGVRRQVLPRGARRRGGWRVLHRRSGAQRDRRGRGRVRHGALRRHPDPDRAGPGRGARGGARRRAGAGLGGRARARRRVRAAGGARPSSTPPARRSPAPEPVVVDAGGLDLLDAEVLAARADAVTLLTPHAGECARLLTRLGPGDEVTREQVEARPLAHARALAELTGATVLLKGATTLVVPPGEGATVWSQADAPPWLATAGAGDVLAGLLGTLLAAGLPADVAGALGALVHGVAADRANPGGPVRALAVAHGIPTAVAHLLGRGRLPAS